MFQRPPATNFDLRFSIFGIPVQVHPLFWVMAVLFGFGLTNPVLIFIWVLVVFFSILIHELGHSLMMRVFGVDSYISLYFMGGLAIPTSNRWGSKKIDTSPSTEQLLISLAGPAAGFLLAGLVVLIVWLMGGFVSVNLLLGFIPVPTAFLFNQSELVNQAIGLILWVNVFWGLINLVPVYPLDGGQAVRQIFIKFDPWDGVRKSILLSVAAGAIMAIVGYVFFGSFYIALLFGLLALQSYQML